MTITNSSAAELLTVGEVAARLRISDATVRRRIVDGSISAVRVGHQYRIPASALGVLRAIEEIETAGDIDAELAMIRAEHEAAEAERAAESARRARIDADRERSDRERAAVFEAMRRSLAQDVGAGGATFEVMNTNATAHGETRRMWEPLRRLWHSLRPIYDARGPKADQARESRHVLAAMGKLPPVRADDAAFGTEDQLRAAVPRFEADEGAIATASVCDSRYGLLVEMLGLSVPRELAPSCESPDAARKRLGPSPMTSGAIASGAPLGTAGTAKKFAGYLDLVPNRDRDRSTDKDTPPNDPLSLYHRELELVAKRWNLARDERRQEHWRALVAQRTEIVAALDRTLDSLPISEAWWWTRQLRRIAAMEPVKLTEDADIGDVSVDKIFHLACAAGARFDINPDTSKPSKKKK